MDVLTLGKMNASIVITIQGFGHLYKIRIFLFRKGRSFVFSFLRDVNVCTNIMHSL